MKTKFQLLLLLATMVLMSYPARAQYSGGNGDGYVSSRSDDILYEGTTPIITGDELPDVVHDLTVNNAAGVTLSKSITITGTLATLNGDFNLNGNTVIFGEFAALQETPGNIVIGGGGSISVTRMLNNLTAGQNVGNFGLTIRTSVGLGQTTIARGNQQQQLTPATFSSRRFFDVQPTNNGNLNAFVEFRYDASELDDVSEADLALFISHDAVALSQANGGKNLTQIAAASTWEFLGGTIDATTKTISKGGVPGFSRLTIARGFVFLADSLVKIDGNQTSAGDLHSNGKIAFGKGEPGTHTGNLTAVGDITIKRNNAIVGDAFAGGTLRLEGNASISGQAQAAAQAAPLVLPTFSFAAGNTAVTIPKRGTLSLPPGAYGEVSVKEHGTLFLRSGEYFLDELDVDKGAVISIDVSHGPVSVNVVSKLAFDEEIEIVITPSGQAATHQVSFVTLQRKIVDIGECALILGWIYAPNAEVHFNEDCRFKGAVVANAVTVDEGAVFVPHSFAANLTKPAPSVEAVASDQSSVTSYQLQQNYPNPFNPTTTIRFDLKEAGDVRLSIYNLQGQEVRTLITSEMPAGPHAINWDGKDQRGQAVPSGMYFYKLRVNGFEQTKKMILTK